MHDREKPLYLENEYRSTEENDTELWYKIRKAHTELRDEKKALTLANLAAKVGYLPFSIQSFFRRYPARAYLAPLERAKPDKSTHWRNRHKQNSPQA